MRPVTFAVTERVIFLTGVVRQDPVPPDRFRSYIPSGTFGRVVASNEKHIIVEVENFDGPGTLARAMLLPDDRTVPPFGSFSSIAKARSFPMLRMRTSQHQYLSAGFLGDESDLPIAPEETILRLNATAEPPSTSTR